MGARAHGEAAAGNERRVFLAMLLTGGFMLAEVAGGVVAGSLALLADAGHKLADTFALTLALFAMWLAERPASAARTVGWRRFGFESSKKRRNGHGRKAFHSSAAVRREF